MPLTSDPPNRNTTMLARYSSNFVLTRIENCRAEPGRILGIAGRFLNQSYSFYRIVKYFRFFRRFWHFLGHYFCFCHQ